MSDKEASSSSSSNNDVQSTQGQKVLNKLMENPFIPIGFIATCTALGIALRKMQQRDSHGYQRWLRARVLAQGVTVVAIVAAGIKEWDKFQLLVKDEGKKGSGRVLRAPRVNIQDENGFKERMMAAEEAHRAENAISAQGNTQAESGAKAVSVQAAQKAQATAEEANRLDSSSSSWWSSWFGVFTKSK